MDMVSLYPGFAEFVVAAHGIGHDLFIVSHKTTHPILGPRHDMHAAARGFLAARGLVGHAAEQIEPSRVFFELTVDAKVARATALRCDMFVDDLPEMLAMPGFPAGMRRILFDPDNRFAGAANGIENVERRTSWPAIAAELKL